MSLKKSTQPPIPATIRRKIPGWQRQLDDHTPILGGLLRKNAARNLIHAAKMGSAEACQVLANGATHHSDLRIRQSCLVGLQQANNPVAVQSLWEVWEQTRSETLASFLQDRYQTAVSPDTLRILSALLLKQEDLLVRLTGAEISALITICNDRDPHIASRARTSLNRLTDSKAIDAVCSGWVQTRSDFLKEIILSHQWTASQPPPIRVMTLLIAGRASEIDENHPDEIIALVHSTSDSDPQIASAAVYQALHLISPIAQDVVCHLVIDQDDPKAHEIALQAGYFPQAVDQRALYFFLTENFTTYEQLDFDRSLLRGAYTVASPELRRRIARLLQTSGRAGDLTVIAGADFRSRAGQVTDEEARIMVNMLSSNQDYIRLWDLALELSLRWSIHILQILQAVAWQPSGEEERILFAALLNTGAVTLSDQDWDPILNHLPLALQRASLKVSGRINALAFAPHTPLLAIASGNRKVAIWDYQKANLTHILNGFNHSVGQVAYANDLLLCGERTNDLGECGIYGWLKDTGFWLGNHQGSITSLIPLPSGRLVSTGRDQNIKLWDLPNRSLITERKFSFWARSAVLSPNHARIAVLHQGVSALELPSLELVHMRRRTTFTDGAPVNRFGVITQGAFVDGDSRILIGRYNGKVTECPLDSPSMNHTPPWASFSGPVVGLEILPDQKMVISAGADGTVQFNSLATRSMLGKFQTNPSGNISSLQVSPDGAFMAIGTTATQMTLWDLRVMDIPSIIARPFANTIPGHLPAVDSLAVTMGLDSGIKNLLSYIQLVLRYRFRREIEISDSVNIKPGEFDILLD